MDSKIQWLQIYKSKPLIKTGDQVAIILLCDLEHNGANQNLILLLHYDLVIMPAAKNALAFDKRKTKK